MPTIPLPRPPLTDAEILLRPWEQRDAPAVTAEARRRGVGARGTRMLSVWALTALGLERLELLAEEAGA